MAVSLGGAASWALSDFATLQLEERREEHRRAASGESYLRLMQLPAPGPRTGDGSGSRR